jgi:hypothetical protein
MQRGPPTLEEFLRKNLKFHRRPSITMIETKREAAHGTDRVTRFQGENAI